MSFRLVHFAFAICLAVCLGPRAALAGDGGCDGVQCPVDPAGDAKPAPQAPVIQRPVPAPAIVPVPPTDEIEGVGTDLPLALALEQIVPPRLKLTISDNVRKDLRVSWHGAGDWKSVLRQLARSNHLTVSFGESAVLIGAQFRTKGASAASKRSAATRNATSAVPVIATQDRHQVPGVDVRTDEPLTSAPKPPSIATAPLLPVSTSPNGGNGIWHAAQGETLDQVLNDWAESSGWTVVFNSQIIYDLQASADFRGDFLQAASALVESIQSKPQPLATFYRGNRALVISNSLDQVN